MNYLIGDIGNTNIKICKINKRFEIVKTYLFYTKDKNLERNINNKIKKILYGQINKKILFSSVVPKVYIILRKIFRKKNMKVHEIKDFNLKKIMKFKVKKLSELGSDRIANAVGVDNKFKSNYIIVDFALNHRQLKVFSIVGC